MHQLPFILASPSYVIRDIFKHINPLRITNNYFPQTKMENFLQFNNHILLTLMAIS